MIMCGIVGVFSFQGQPVDQNELIQARETIAHRGPDDIGVYISRDQTLGFGFRRLAILDVSTAGHQPMSGKDGRFWIVFNGEIYNFLELRQDLEKEGESFSSRSDTEVLLALYKKEGPRMLDKLRGMFAFAIWEEKERRLFLARDRAGKKPLYWTIQQGRFIFASEIKAILAFRGIARRLNEEAFGQYLSFLVTIPPLTLFQGINKLPAGHHLTVAANGSVNVSPYWDPLAAANKRSGPVSINEAKEELIHVLRESIRYRMVSDVPFGVFLSGGIDSSANLALMSELMKEPAQSFSVGYPPAVDFGELQWARHAAVRFGAKHHEIIIQEQDLIDFIPRMVFHQDEPLADPVCVPVYFVSQLAKRYGVIVAQVGEGADELFAGYPAWFEALRLDGLSRHGLVRAVMGWGLPLLETYLRGRGRGAMRLEWLKRASRNEVVFQGGAEGFCDSAKERILGPRLKKKLCAASSWESLQPYWKRFKENSRTGHALDWMTYIDLNLRLPELLLMRVDKMSMANSVETRAPFLDHRLIELVLSLPPETRITGHRPKGLLKEALREILPPEIIARPKQGFAVPIEKWFWGHLGRLTRETLERLLRETDYFDETAVKEFAERKNAQSWQLLNFALWHQHWIERN
ncbi:MAG: asparagine synthase (glutamine-hydrolyzing) [Elusimicrobia bacterium]|nr:asparagine synthase (glutamine-hydrolyzing) [Elusimicrobiota bacterium]